MANKNCAACDELRQDASNLIVNGLGDTECNSLKNDTGLNPSSGNNDCTDLENMNDCFVGNMADEIDSYDVCDWKDFMKKFIPNLWTVLKGIICAICGIWTNIHSLWTRLNQICALVEANMQHPVTKYGVLPNGDSTKRGGTLGLKGGSTILVARPRSELSEEVWQGQNVGINYGKLNIVSCSSGSCVRHEWISPDIIGYKFNQAPAYDDVLWYCDKATAQSRFGITDAQWDAKTRNPVGWYTDFSAGNALIGLALGVNNNRLELRFANVIGATLESLNGAIIQPPADQAERLYRFPCSSN